MKSPAPHASPLSGRVFSIRALSRMALLLAMLGTLVPVSIHLTKAQHATPTINGTIGASEYGNHADGQNAKTNGGTTWYMTWDDTNLYIGISGANTSEGAVIYLDRHAVLSTSGTNADGNTTGQEYDNTNFSSLPMRADFVAYFKDGYQEYRTADGAGGWSAPTVSFGSYASNSTTVRELSIPWSAITGGARPAQFGFLGYVTSPGGFVYGEIPPENTEGFIGTSATATRFYRVGSTANGASTKPFSQNFLAARAFTVNSTLDTADATPGDNLCDDGAGNCTLRAAIEEANAVTSYDAINFNIGGGGLQSIAPATALPNITDLVIIDGFTQPGASANTNPTTQLSNATMLIELNGAGAGSGVDGLRLAGGGATIRGLVINRFTDDGISMVANSDSNVIAGNYIGTDPTGMIDLGNSNDGIASDVGVVTQTPENNRIGGTSPADRNVISGNNNDGIAFIFSGDNTVQGNFIGLKANGIDTLGNGGDGINLSSSGGSTIGGTNSAARNLISGNGGRGIGTSSSNATIIGNYIGTDVTGTLDRGNIGHGISTNVSAFTIGGASPGAGNLISGNNGHGVFLGNSSGSTVQGNLIGTQADGLSPLGNSQDGIQIFAGSPNSNTIGGTNAGEGNTIAFNGGDGIVATNGIKNRFSANSIHSNGSLGIDLSDDDVTPNDVLDADTGPNNLQNYPELTAVSTVSGTTTVTGTLNSTPNSTFSIEFFSSNSCDSTGFGEGQTFLGARTVTTDASGNAVINEAFTPAISTTRVVTATATVTNDPADASNVNNTSEFSQCVQEPAPPAIYVVNTASDTNDADQSDGLCLDAGGLCSLRAAIQQANANLNTDTINFLIPDPNVQTINVGSTGLGALPQIIHSVTIDGYTQPGASENTLAVGNNAVIKIELNGASAGAGADGLNISAGNCLVRGLSIYNFNGDGIDLHTTGSNVITGNFIGTTFLGGSNGVASANGGDGVNINNVSFNLVGGGAPEIRNVISGNTGNGVEISGSLATFNAVQGNYIGIDKSGGLDIGNGVNGVLVSGPINEIGCSATAPGQSVGNVISGNGQAGVRLTTGSNGSFVQGNIIGLRADGSPNPGDGTIPNSGEAGVFITNGATSITVGGSTSDLRNIISGNTGDGVEIDGAGTDGHVVQSNYIGTDINGTVDRGNLQDGVRIDNGAETNQVGELTSTPGTSPGNVISGNDGDGVDIANNTTAGNTVQGNLIGLNKHGTAALRNTANGVLIDNSSNNTIGGTSADARNVITGGANSTSSDGVDIQGGDSADNNKVQGNYIGTDINGTGTNGVNNCAGGSAGDFGACGDGVRISGGGDNNQIGGSATTPGTVPGNVIAGHNGDGVEITGSGTTNNLVRGNLIGTQVNGTTGYGNANGVLLSSSSTTNTVGGATSTPGTGLGNVISGNSSDGVEITSSGNFVQGNLIGLQAGGTVILSNTSNGVFITAGGLNSTIGGSASSLRNIISGNGLHGVQLNEAQVGVSDNSVVAGNYIGTDITGAVDLGNGAINAGGSGVEMVNCDAVTIGGTASTPGAAPGNLISGNTNHGIRLNGANSNFIRGNLIGTKINGTEALPNGVDGINLLSGAPTNTIGGTAAGQGNVISGNTGDGIDNPNATGTLIQGNFIGTNLTASGGVANGGAGVRVSASSATANISVTIGGTSAGAPNTIAFNTSDGVQILGGTRIAVQRNSIYSNGGLGIDIDDDGVTPNDLGPPHDADTGANNLQNFPVLTSVTSNGSQTTVQGALNSTASSTFNIEIFANSVGCDPSGFGEGQTYLGSTTATTNANGDATFTYVHPSALPLGQSLTATATNSTNNTSEFSACGLVVPALTIDDLMIAEGNTGTVNAVFTVRLSVISPVDVTVQYSTQDDTATSPPDYQSVTNATVTIPAGSATGTFNVVINGDIVFEGNEQFFINLSNPTDAAITDSQATAIINDDEPTNADFDGDGLTDVSVWRSSEGNWYWLKSSDGTLQTHVDWGRDTLGDIAVPGDYDGDNKTDLAVWRPSEGNWYIVNSSDNSITTKGWGLGSLGDVPVPADYDGDGKTDLAVWRGPEGNWYIINSATNTTTVRSWGASSLNDKPVVGDYDGDGRADLAVWRPSEGNWYIINSATNTVTLRAWGAGSLSDKPVQADYDGDGKTDLAVWRPSEGTWYIINSRDDSITTKHWGSGSLGDVPVPGNYDGDNRADIAVWRPHESNWYIISSRDDIVIRLNLGLNNDVLIPAAYFPQ